MDKTTKTGSCNNKKNIAITIGDVGGVGPEIAISLFKHTISNKCNIILIGCPKIFEKAKILNGIKKEINILNNFENFDENCINVIEISENSNYTFNKTSLPNAKLAFNAIKTAISLAIDGKVDAIVTSPISKEGLKLANINFPGHTEILSHYTNSKKYRMLFVSKYFNVLLHTIHIPIKEVFTKIKEISLEETILIGYEFCKKYLRKKEPLIYVAGLNPHAGENGNIGNEEIEYILPIIKKLNHINIKGPLAPDTLFYNALKEKPDLIIAMYHDQGLIPLKLLDFHGAVNVTLGIPFIRTSPDHGTAFDIAWKGIAKNSSMINAVSLAIKLS